MLMCSLPREMLEHSSAPRHLPEPALPVPSAATIPPPQAIFPGFKHTGTNSPRETLNPSCITPCTHREIQPKLKLGLNLKLCPQSSTEKLCKALHPKVLWAVLTFRISLVFSTSGGCPVNHRLTPPVLSYLLNKNALPWLILPIPGPASPHKIQSKVPQQPGDVPELFSTRLNRIKLLNY